MAITAFSQWSTTAASNTDLNSIPLDGASMLANQVDDAIRELMAQLASAGFITLTGVTSTLSPATSDGAALGSTTKMWSDLFLASGGVINWNNGDVTATHSSNALAFGGASSGYSFDAKVYPAANDGAALGDTTHNFSDLFLAAGAVINFNGGDVTITHGTNLLAIAGAANGYSFDAGIFPATNDGGALGDATHNFSDAFLAAGGVINWNNGDVTITHNTNLLTIAGATNGYAFNDGVVSLGAGQLQFPASQNASADANTLDDYEELNEAAISQGAGISSGTGTITTASGTRSYIKVGRLVTVTFDFTISNNGTAGTSYILTLPFTAAATGGPWVGAGKNMANGQAETLHVAEGASTATLVKYDGNDPSSLANIVATVTYFAAS